MAINRTSPKKGKVLDVPDKTATVGTVTVSGQVASVPYTLSSETTGGPVTKVTVVSTPGSLTATGSSSPISVSGLSVGTSYTFKAQAGNPTGSTAQSASSNSVTGAMTVQYLVLAGGGSGGRTGFSGGGGGAGGYLESSLGTIALSTNYTVTVGAGGTYQGSGSASVFSNINATGGGYGGGSGNSSSYGFPGANGGSGGGAAGGDYAADANNAYGGSPVSGQGYAGGGGRAYNGGGGGGAGGAGNTGGSSGNAAPGNGGSSVTSSILGVAKAGGGGGSQAATNGAGGSGGGANAGNGGNANGGGNAAGANSGSGGGGGCSAAGGGAGGSGIVALKYPDTYTITIGAGLTGTTAAPSGGYKVSTITAGTGNVSWA